MSDDGRCAYCGQTEGHSPRCSVTKFGAPFEERMALRELIDADDAAPDPEPAIPIAKLREDDAREYEYRTVGLGENPTIAHGDRERLERLVAIFPSLTLERRLRATPWEPVDEHEKGATMAESYIEWWDKPDANARRYRHIGCDDPHRYWTLPLDDCPPPTEATHECVYCCHVVALREHEKGPEG